MKALYVLSVLALASSLCAAGWGRIFPDPDEVLRDHLVEGTALLLKGKAEDAARELRLALPVRTRALELAVHHNLGLACLLQSTEGNPKGAGVWAAEAVRELEAALEIQPGHGSASWNLELALRRLKSLDSGPETAWERDAERLLSSFRLQEEAGMEGNLREMVRHDETGRGTSAHRGPPW